ncbi:AAA family ATPase [Candidatus Peregrinibacteria bacterium]|nr:AAA family ATPase [Candidatus Peregrinibacteria bacterium]
MQENFQKYYKLLNSEQQKAVDTIDGPVMVIAGAGTGKTQILSVRIANILLQTQIDPQNILCLTFTEAGVVAMRKRLLSIIGNAAYHVKICTFHSFCNEIIKDNPDHFAFKRDFEQIDDLEKIKIIQSIIDRAELNSPLKPANDHYYYQKDIENIIRSLKQENIFPEDFHKICLKIEEFLNHLKPIINEFIDSKGRPDENFLNETIQKIDISSELENNFYNLVFNKFHHQIKSDYLNSLTGNKRNDGSQRTMYRNKLREFFKTTEKDLPKQFQLTEIYKNYQELMKQKGLYDFEDMILFVTQKLQTNTDLLRDYQEKYQYILVDEYQDTNSTQNLTVDLLGQFFENPNLFVVGDDDQSIYRFQGASIENIINYYHQYQNHLEIITLTKNYRSQQTILDAASTVIKNNNNRIASQIENIDKNLQSQTEIKPAKIKVLEFENDQIENLALIEIIQNLIENGTKPSEIALLYRNHHHAEDIIDILQRKSLPYHVHAGVNILEDLQIASLLLLFKTIANPNQNDLLAQSLFLNFLAFPKEDILKICYYFHLHRYQNKGLTLLNIISNPAELEKAHVKKINAFNNFALKIVNWKVASENTILTEYFEQILKESGFLNYLIEQENKVDALNRIKTLFEEARKYTRLNHKTSITEFLENLRLRSENKLPLKEKSIYIEKEAIQLLTAHGAKGLEFEHVFIIKATQKNWLNSKKRQGINIPRGIIKTESQNPVIDQEEDERRLFYVALTRAKKMAYISYAKLKFDNGKEKNQESLLFLNEIPEEFKEYADTQVYSHQANDLLEEYLLSDKNHDFKADQIAFLKTLVEHHKISPTSLNNYLTCPRKFLYQNIIRIPQAKNKFSAMGSAIHSTLDYYFRSYKQTGSKPPLDLMLIKYKSALEKELLEEKDFQERLELGIQILTDYFHENQDNFSGDIETEYNFSSHGVNVDGIPITGKIDKITFNSDQTLTVTDFKTGNPDNAISKVKHGEDYWRQLIFYKILSDDSPQFNNQFKQKAKIGQIEFVEKSKKTGTYINKSISFDKNSIDEVKENIRFVHQQIQNLEFDKIEKSETCDKCPFYNICWTN